MKKRLCGLAAACLFAAVFSGCGPAEGSAESAPVTESAPPIESGPVTDSAPPALSEELTQEELDELSAFLSQPGVCELFWSGFAAPEEADLSAMLYDGAGLEQGPLTQEEAEALGSGADLDVTKLTTAQIQELLRERLGLAEVEADWLQEKLPDWIYLPDYDAFYLCHGDTLMRSVTCEMGMRGRDSDSVKLICRTDAGERYAAVLTENSGGSWRIDSILSAD